MPEGWPYNEAKRKMMKAAADQHEKDQAAAVVKADFPEDESISSQESDSDSFDDVNEFNEMSELPIEPKRSFLNYHEEQRLMTTMAVYTPVLT